MPMTAAEWMDLVASRMVGQVTDVPILLAMLRDAKAELERLEGQVRLKFVLEGGGMPPKALDLGVGWAAIEAKWREGKYR